MVDVGKREDQLLDYIATQRDTIKALEIELAAYRTIVPDQEVDPARV